LHHHQWQQLPTPTLEKQTFKPLSVLATITLLASQFVTGRYSESDTSSGTAGDPPAPTVLLYNYTTPNPTFTQLDPPTQWSNFDKKIRPTDVTD
jgi:hypothetical protein